jgi:putative protease
MLKITSPFREKKEVIPLIEAGADELYCGYLSPDWVKRYTSLEFERKGGGSNFTDLKELKKAVDLAHKKGIPVYLTLNGLYVRQQYPLLVEIVNQLNKIDLDGYIVADIGLLLTLRKQGFKKQIHISTGGTVFNSEAARFYKNLGASRIILDRQTTLESMRALSQDSPDLDFEVFILNTLCVYIDGFCTFLHPYRRDSEEDISKKDWEEEERLHLITVYDPEAQADACCLKYSVGVYNDSRLNERIDTDKIQPTFYKQLIDGAECGACAIYEINKTRVKSIKIVGRQITSDARLQSTKFIRVCLGILEDNEDINRKDFIHKVQGLYQKTFEYKKRCKGNNCYYPEILYKV